MALADKLSNITAIAADYADMGEELWQRFRRGKESQRWLYQGMVQALRDDSADEAYQALHTRFARVVREVFGASP